MPRTAVLEAVLSAAMDVARRRHHPVVRASHVLTALFASSGMDRRIRRRGFDADHLASAVERALDDAPAATGYRDGAPPSICPSIDLAFDRVEKLVGAYGVAEIVAALDDAPELHGAFRPYVLDESLVARMKREAPGRDIADAMTWLLANHLDLADRLVDGGLDAVDLTTRCGSSYGDILPVAIDAARSAGEARVEAALLMAFFTREIAYSAGYELPVIGEALDVLLHGAPVVDGLADDAPAELVFVDDGLTGAGTVQGILTAHFGMSVLEAHDTVIAIGARGEAVVARTAARPARELAELVRRAARRAGDPLRVVVRARAY